VSLHRINVSDALLYFHTTFDIRHYSKGGVSVNVKESCELKLFIWVYSSLASDV
jgi:hypothetical protein